MISELQITTMISVIAKLFTLNAQHVAIHPVQQCFIIELFRLLSWATGEKTMSLILLLIAPTFIGA